MPAVPSRPPLRSAQPNFPRFPLSLLALPPLPAAALGRRRRRRRRRGRAGSRRSVHPPAAAEPIRDRSPALAPTSSSSSSPGWWRCFPPPCQRYPGAVLLLPGPPSSPTPEAPDAPPADFLRLLPVLRPGERLTMPEKLARWFCELELELMV
ncbi:proline-rich protein 36-like [Aquila chrysaetos chrysaetos]|uniref:proline-rich protein 36-like n=1 Tax=Aquila chrysaetos chrysaetos TaxID=223781 RepID=UPI00117710D0|nr:proline-rich protein 36-like [Aquila chrysaetos chrysaetos]